MALGVERGVRDLGGGALVCRSHPLRIELVELVEQGPDQDLDRAEPGGGAPHPGITPQALARRNRVADFGAGRRPKPASLRATTRFAAVFERGSRTAAR